MGTTIGRIVSLENPWKNLFDLKNSKTHLGRATQRLFCLFGALKCPFWKFGALIFMYYYNFLLDTSSCTCLKFFSLLYLGSLFYVHGILISSSAKQWVHTDWLIDFAHIVTEIFRCKGTHTQTEFNSSQNILINLLFD